MAKVKPVGLFLIFPCVALHKGDPQGSPGLGGVVVVVNPEVILKYGN